MSAPWRQQRAVTMVVVLWIILVLSLLISGFAYTMHVETQIASYARKELKAVLLARSGVEVARWQLRRHQQTPAEVGFEALNQVWATNETLYVDHQLGAGKFSVEVIDEERKLPLNQLSEEQWKRLLAVLEVDPAEADIIVDSVVDWTDGNDLHQLNGAESDYYQALTPPYRAKNGPFDRLEELLLVRGVTRELFEPAPSENDEPARPGLGQLLSVFSSGRVNVNTASALVLEVAFGLDETVCNTVLERRNGPDGQPGTEDDQPYKNLEEFIREVAGGDPLIVQDCRQYGAVGATAFTVQAVGQVGTVRRSVQATLKRQGNDYVIATWSEGRPRQ